MAQEFILKSEEATSALARKIARQIKGRSILVFNGESGAGKTFFCRQIIRSFCGDDTPVASPTFNLLQIYQAGDFAIYHFDLYRLSKPEEAYELGIEEAFADQLCLIEWPGIISHLLPEGTISISLAIIDQKARSAVIHGLTV